MITKDKPAFPKLLAHLRKYVTVTDVKVNGDNTNVHLTYKNHNYEVRYFTGQPHTIIFR